MPSFFRVTALKVGKSKNFISIFTSHEGRDDLQVKPSWSFAANVLPDFPSRIPSDDTSRNTRKLNAIRTWKNRGSPYFKSPGTQNDLRPIIPYLFTEWKCNSRLPLLLVLQQTKSKA